jgi:hypothetical protein
MNMAQHWDNQVRTYWSKNYHIELSELLKGNGVKSILDKYLPKINFKTITLPISS